MKKEKGCECGENCCREKLVCKGYHGRGGGDQGALYGLGVIGALFYFLQNASGLGTVLIGIGKAIFWPAIVLFKVLTLLQI